MCFAIKQLQSSDRLAIVLFESNVSVLFQLTQMTGDAKHRATELVQRINVKGSTALAGGLERGYEVLIEDLKQQQQNKKEESINKKVTSILLFTDGQANVGLQSPADIVEMLKSQQKRLNKACTVFSFGYGSDHSVDLLRGIAEAGSGMYYYVEDEEKIASAFGDCIGGLLSVSAQNLELKLQTQDEGVKIKKLFGSSEKVGGTEVNSNKYSMQLGDIYHEEERNILVLLEIQPLSDCSVPFEQRLLDFQLKGFDVLQADTFEVKQSLSLIRDKETKKNIEKSELIGIQKNRLLTVEAVDSARKLANENKFEQAREVLRKAIQTLKSSEQSQSNITKLLIADLEESLNDMKNQAEFVSVGSKKMAMCSRSHQVERAVHSKQMYCNSSKSATKQAFISK